MPMSPLLQIALNGDLTFPTFFALYTFLFALTVLYYLLLSPNVRALMLVGPLQKLLRWALGQDQQIRISGIGFALLSGKIYLNHFEYRTKNICIRILQSTVRINWWFTEVRESDSKHDDKLPCRLSLEFVGFEYIIYHNSYAYDHLAELIFGAAGIDLKKEMEDRKGGGDENSTSHNLDEDEILHEHKDYNGPNSPETSRGRKADAAVAAKPRRTPLPIFYRFFPVTKVTVKSLNLMIGNLKTPNFLVFTTSSAQILHSTGKGVSAHASYQSMTEISHITDAEVYLQRNTAYLTPQELFLIKKELDQEDYFVIAIATMSKILKQNAGGPGPVYSEKQTNVPRSHDPTPTNTFARRKKPQPNGTLNHENGIQMAELYSDPSLESTPLVDNGLGLGFETDRDLNTAASTQPEIVIEDMTGGLASEMNGASSLNGTAQRRKKTASNADSTHPPPSTIKSSSSATVSDREYILECKEFTLEYSYDIADPLSEFDITWFASHLKAVPHHAAKQRLRVEFLSQTNITYGPWTDHQRALLMSYFKPWDYRNQKVFVPKVGEPWPYTSLLIEAVWRNDESKIRMPYRDLYKLMTTNGLDINNGETPLPDHMNTASRATEAIEITFQSDSWVSYEMGWAVLESEKGSTTTIKADLQHAIIWSGLPSASTLPRPAHLPIIFQPLVESDRVEVGCNLNYPTLWNSVYKWNFQVNFHASKLWYYSNHIDLFKIFTLDWSKYSLLSSLARKVGGRSLSYFLPVVYEYNILFTEYEVYLNVNEGNVQQVREYLPGSSIAEPAVSKSTSTDNISPTSLKSHPSASSSLSTHSCGTLNHLDHSTFIILRGPDIVVKLTTPYLNYHAKASKTTYDVTIRNLRAHLSLPKNHQLYELIESKTRMQFLYLNQFQVKGHYQGHYKYNPEVRDSHTIDLTIEGGEADLTGYYAYAIWNFKANYLGGDNMNWISSDEFIKYGRRNIHWWNKQMKYYEGSSGSVKEASGPPTSSNPPQPSATGSDSSPSGGGHAHSSSNVSSGMPIGLMDDHNVSELYLSVLAENLALNLPLHLFTNPSPSHQPKIRCYNLQLEIRSVQQYFDLMLNLAPVTITIPIPLSSPLMQVIRVSEDDTTSPHRNRSWNEKETFIHLKDFVFSWHQSKGDLPRLTVYRSLQKIGIGSILVQLFPQQLLTFVTCVNNFIEQYKEAYDYCVINRSRSTSQPIEDGIELPSFTKPDSSLTRDTPEEIQIKSELTSFLTDRLLSTRLADLGMEVNIGSFILHLLHPPLPPTALTVTMAHQAVAQMNIARTNKHLPAGAASTSNPLTTIPTAHLSLTRVILGQGMQIYSTSLITPQAHSKTVMEVPNVDISYLICTDVRKLSCATGVPTNLPSPAFERLPSLNDGPQLSPPFDLTNPITINSEDDNISRWIAICQIRLGMNLTQAQQRSDWLNAMRKQQDFIYSQMHQEGPMDDTEAYPWHESNANKVPYVLVDDVAAGFVHDHVMQQQQYVGTYAQLPPIAPGRLPNSDTGRGAPISQQQQTNSVYVPAHHQQPRFMRSRTTSFAGNEQPPPKGGSVTIEDEDEKVSELPIEMHTPITRKPSIIKNANQDTTLPATAPVLSREPSSSGSTSSAAAAHYLSHIRQRSFQISRGGLQLRRASIVSRPNSAAASPAPLARALPLMRSPDLARTHSLNYLRSVNGSSQEGQRDSYESAGANDANNNNSSIPPSHHHYSQSRDVPSQSRNTDDADVDDFESCKRFSETDEGEEGDTFHDFSNLQIEGVPPIDSATSPTLHVHSYSLPTRPTITIQPDQNQLDESPKNNISSPNSSRSNGSAGMSPRGHLRSQSQGVFSRLNQHKGGILVMPTFASTPRHGHHESISSMPGGNVGATVPIAVDDCAIHFPDYVPPLPTPDLQAYLEHYALEVSSHAFVQGGSRRAGVIQPQLNKATIFDSSLAGTSAGAYLSLPVVQFESLTSATEESTETGDETFDATFTAQTTSYSGVDANAYIGMQHRDLSRVQSSNTTQPTFYQPTAASTANSTNVSRRGSLTEATNEGILPVPTPHINSAMPSNRPILSRDRSFSVSQVKPGDASTSATSQVTMETTHAKHVVYNTSKLVLEFTSDVTVMLCPSFIANMDQYLPFLQAGYTTVEDTLDELHMQFTRVFKAAAEPVVVAPTTKFPIIQPDQETWHTTSVQRSVILPRLYIELLQSSISSVGATQTSTTSVSNLQPSRRRRSFSGPLQAREPTPVIYATTVSLEGVTANIAQSYPLPTTYTNHTTGMQITNSTPLPSAQGQVSMNRLHAYSCILNPPRYCGKEEAKSPNSLDHGGHVHDCSCWGPNSVAIPQQELEALLPPAILSTSAVFVSVELNNTVLSLQHSTTTELNPLYVKPTVVHIPPASLSSPLDDALPPTERSSGSVLWHEGKPAHSQQPSIPVYPAVSSTIIQSATNARLLRPAAKPGTHYSGNIEMTSLGGAATARSAGSAGDANDSLHRSFSFQVNDGQGTTMEELKRREPPPKRSSYFLNPSLPVVLPSPSTLNAFTHSHSSLTRLHVDNVAVLSGWDAPSRVVTVTRDWITALGQLECVGVSREWIGDSGVLGAQELDDDQPTIENEAEQTDKATSSSSSSKSQKPSKSAKASAKAGANPALALFATLPGGPATALRRSRWQTLLAFALQHVVHSRALDENRGGSKAFGEQDQLRLLQWLHHRNRVNLGTPQAMDPEFIDEVGAMLSAHHVSTRGIVKKSALHPSGTNTDSVASSDLNFIQSRAAPLTLALRKLLKLPPSLMRRLNFKLQRSEDASAAAGGVGSAGVLAVGAPVSGVSTASNGDIDFVKLYENEKLEASELARLTLQVFALLAPQAAKVRVISRIVDLSPSLWQSVNHMDYHRSEVDQRDFGIEWELMRVRVRITHAPAHDHSITTVGPSLGRTHSLAHSSSNSTISSLVRRDHAISLNTLNGMASFTRHNTFTKQTIPAHHANHSSFSTRGDLPPTTPANTQIHVPQTTQKDRIPALVRSTAFRELARNPPLGSPTSSPNKFGATLSPPPTSSSSSNPFSPQQPPLTGRVNAAVSPILEGREDGRSPNANSPPQFTRRLDVASPNDSPFSLPSPLNFPLAYPTSNTYYHWSLLQEFNCTAHSSDVLVDIGPDIHRFLASLAAATFVFADIHARNMESTKNAARRMKNQATLGDDPVILFEKEQQPTKPKSSASSVSATHKSNSDSSLLDYVHAPFVTFNYLLQCNVDTVGIRARVPGTASLHIVTQGCTFCWNSFRPLTEAELEAKRHRAGGGVGSGVKKKGRDRKSLSQAAALAHAYTKVSPLVSTFTRARGVGGNRFALSGAAGAHPTHLHPTFASRLEEEEKAAAAAASEPPISHHENRMVSATVKMHTLDIRLMDQDVDGSMEDITESATSSAASSTRNLSSKKKGTVLFSLYLRLFTFNMDQALLTDALEMNKHYLSATKNSSGQQSPDTAPPPILHHHHHHAQSVADRSEAGLSSFPSMPLSPGGSSSKYRPYSHSAAVPPPAGFTRSFTTPNSSSSAGSSISSTAVTVTGSNVQRLIVVINSEQSVFTLPFHQLEKMHVHDYIDPWKPVVAVFNASSALDEAKAEEEAEANAAKMAAEASQSEGYTSAAFAWMRGETKKPIPVAVNPSSGTAAAPMASMSSYLSSSSTSAASYTHWSILCQLRGVSVVMLPLATVMFTYHLDRIYVKLTSPKPQELHLLLSIGQESEKSTPNLDGSNDLSLVSTHKITLHSANVKKKKPTSHVDHDDRTESSRSESKSSLSSSRHPLEKPITSRSKSTKYLAPGLTQRENDRRSPVASSNTATSGGAGHATTSNKMQFVLEFRLPTVRASLRIREHDLRTTTTTDHHQPTASSPSNQILKDINLSPHTLVDVIDQDSDSSSDYETGTTSSSGSGSFSDSSSSSDEPVGHMMDIPYKEHHSHQRSDHRSHETNRNSNNAATSKSKNIKSPQVLNEIDGLIAVGSMSNHLDENVLSRLLHLQSTLNTEVNQLLDKFAQYSKEAGLEEVASFGHSGSRRRTSGGGNGKPGVSRRSTSPSMRGPRSPANARPRLSKRLSTLDDLSMNDEPLSPISQAFRSSGNGQHRSPYAPLGHAPPPAAHLKGHPMMTKPEKGLISHPANPKSDESNGSIWDRYTFNVNFVFENIHITAGLSPKKTALPTPKHSMTMSPRGAIVSSVVAARLQTTNPTQTAHERAAQFQPILHVTTGTFSLSMRYRPKGAIKPMNLLEAKANEEKTVVGSKIEEEVEPTSTTNARANLHINVDKIRRTPSPPSQLLHDSNDDDDEPAVIDTSKAKTVPASAPPNLANNAPASIRSIFKTEDGSNVIVEMTFQGIGLKMSTLARHPSFSHVQNLFQQQNMGLPPNMTGLPFTTQAARRTLVECRADIRLRVGFKVNATYTHADCVLEQTLMKVTAIPITTTSLYVLASTYMHAYAEFQVEKARLVQEKEIRDPLIGLRALKADRVWSHLQSEFPAIKDTITAATTAQTTPITNSNETGSVLPPPTLSRLPSEIDTNEIETPSGAPGDLLSPTSAAAAVAIAAGQENPLMQVGTGSMLPLSVAAGPTGTKYELHFCMQATELVMLFEKDGSKNVLDEKLPTPYDPMNPFGTFNSQAYEQYGYQTDSSSMLGGVNLQDSPTSSAATSLSALVIFLDELDIKLDYAPPSPAAYRYQHMLAPFVNPSLAYAMQPRPPVNSLGSEIRVTGLELGCLSEDIPDTNILDDLANTLRKYRAQPAAHHPTTTSSTSNTSNPSFNSPQFDGIDVHPLSPRDVSYMKKYPFRSYSLHTPSDSALHHDQAHGQRHIYNRIVVQSTRFRVRGALPVTAPSHEELSATTITRERGGSGSHSRHRSQQWSGTNGVGPMTSPPLGATSAPTALSITQSNEMTIVVDTHCTGAELDIDPSLVNHLNNLTSLVQLLSNFAPPSQPSTGNPTPRGSIHEGSSEGLNSPLDRLTRASSSASMHSRSKSAMRAEDADFSLPSPSNGRGRSSFGSNSGRSKSTRPPIRGRVGRRNSLPSNNREVDSDEDGEGQDSINTSSATLPISPQLGGMDGGVVATHSNKLDLSIEFKLNIEHGRCCLHPLPKQVLELDDTISSPSTTSADSPTAAEEVYADFVLPSIISTLVIQTIPTEEVLFLLDLNLPPLTLNPTIMAFLNEVKLEFEKVESERRTQTPSAGAETNDFTDSPTNDNNQAPILNMMRGANTNTGGTNEESNGTNRPDGLTLDTGLGEITPATGLAGFLQSCAAVGRSITVNIRLKHTYIKLNCLPMNEQVYLQFGSKRNIDICVSIAALDQVKLGIPVAIPYVSCTVNVPAVFVQLGLLNPFTSASTSVKSIGTSSAAAGPTFLDIRCRHIKLQVIEAFNIRSDAAPIRTVLFNVESISPALITMNVVAAFVVFSKVWLIQTAANQRAEKNSTEPISPPSATADQSQALVLASSVTPKFTAARASFYQMSIGKIEAEVNMLDVVNVHNKSIFSISRLSSRVLDVGGCFPIGCYPIMIAVDTGELTMKAEPESDGLDGKFICSDGLQWRFCRLPLQVVHKTSFDFHHPAEDTDSERSVAGSDTDRESVTGTEGEEDYSNTDREDDDDEDEWSDATADEGEHGDEFHTDGESGLNHTHSSANSSLTFKQHTTRNSSTRIPSTMQLMSRQGKRMVNMMELNISDTTSHFHVNHGLTTPLLVLHSSHMQISMIDQWNDRVDSVGYLENDGDWSVLLNLDIGERLSLEASSRALPYFFEIITHLIAFTQHEFKRVELPKVETLFPLRRRPRSTTAPILSTPNLGRRNNDEPRDLLDTKRKNKLDLLPPTRIIATTTAPASHTPLKPLRAGVLTLKGAFLELKLGSDTIALEREFVCVEIHGFSVSLHRSLFYSTAQLREQRQLLQLKRKYESMAQAAHRESLLFSDAMPVNNFSPGGYVDPATIKTEEELSVAIALLDEETDPLKRLQKRSNEPFRGGSLRPFIPLDIYRTLLVDVGQHQKVPHDSGDPNKATYLWIPVENPAQPTRTYISQLGANGPGIYVSRLKQAMRDRDADDMDHIFRIPGFVLEMETLDPFEQSVVRSRFLTFWDKSITVAIDVRVYKLLRGMALAFADQLAKALQQMGSQAKEAQDVASKAIKEAASSQVVTRTIPPTVDTSHTTARQRKDHDSDALIVVPNFASTNGNGAASKRSVRFNLEVPSDHTTTGDNEDDPITPTPPSPRPGRMIDETAVVPISHPPPSSSSSTTSTAASSTSARSSPRPVQRSLSLRGKHLLESAPPTTAAMVAPPPAQLTTGPSSVPLTPVAVVPPAPKLHKPFAPDSHYDLNNPAIHVLDHASSSGGISVRKIIEIMQSLNANLKAKDLKKEEQQVIPAATHELTEVLDQVLHGCINTSKKIDHLFEG